MPADPAQAVPHYRIAAEAGEADAQLALARLYRTGTGVAEDPAEAERWAAAAAKSLESDAAGGDARAQQQLGELYLAGQGVPKNPGQGLAWLQASADQGRVWAQAALGRLYDKGGDGVPPNPERAATYYKMAAEQGHSGARKALKRIEGGGKGRPAEAGPQVAVAEPQGPTAKGEPGGYARLGDLYASGTGVPRDDAEALRWYGEGARHGDPAALFRVGEVYQQGRGVEADPVEALGWYMVAQQQGYADAGERIAALSTQLDPEAVQDRETARRCLAAQPWSAVEPDSRSFSGA